MAGEYSPTDPVSPSALKPTSSDDIIYAAVRKDRKMRTTIVLDDELVAKAADYTGIREKSALVREALRRLIEREAARRLARLGGSQPQLKPIPRRRMPRK
jgi:Arc/MetJ family transcription regulator